MTREEAIKTVRNIYQTDKEKEALEILIPELHESEDERIINAIIGILKNSNAIDINVSQEKMFAWLEKQKEHQNNSDAPEKALGRDLTFTQDKDKDLDEIAQDYVDGVKEYNPEPTWDLMQTAVCYGYHYREQKEQKPRLIGEDSVEKIARQMYETGQTIEEQKPAEGDYETEIQKAFREGKSAGRKEVFDHPEEYGLQKPTEWSKNDTAFLNEITDFFENKTVRLQHDIDMYAHWLKSLPERFNLQPKQEWGEEDEKILNDAYCWLCEYAGCSLIQKNHKKSSMLYEIAEKLKSLRPQPKEQDVEKIQALKAVLENRLNLLHKAIETSKKNKTHRTTKWLDGKECGYSDVLKLLNSRLESIRIEL